MSAWTIPTLLFSLAGMYLVILFTHRIINKLREEKAEELKARYK